MSFPSFQLPLNGHKLALTMFSYPILQGFFLTLMFPEYCSGFKIDINHGRYNNINIYLIRDTNARDSQYRRFYIHRRTNLDLNIIVQRNQHLQTATWVIKDSDLEISNVFSLAFKQNQQNATFNVYSSEKIRGRSSGANPIGTLSLIITEAYQLCSGASKQHEWISEPDYHLQWGRWLSFITGFRKISFFKTTVITFAITPFHAHDFLQFDWRDSILDGPFLTFIVNLGYTFISRLADEYLNFRNIAWVCQACKVEYSLYNAKSPFVGMLNAALTHFYFNQVYSNRLQYLPEVVAISKDHQVIGIDKLRTKNPFLSDWQYRNYHFKNKVSRFDSTYFETFPVALNLLAKSMNYTLVFGGLNIEPFWRRRYVEATFVKMSISPKNLKVEFPEAVSFIPWDSYRLALGYYKKDVSFEVPNFFLIATARFDLPTRICVCVLISLLLVVVHLIFAKLAFETNCGTYRQAICTVIQIIIKKQTRKLDAVRFATLVGFFFIRCFYAIALRQELIAPVKPYHVETLSELLKSGYKFTQIVNNNSAQENQQHEILYRENLAYNFEAALGHENFQGSLLLSAKNNPKKYWWLIYRGTEGFVNKKAIQVREIPTLEGSWQVQETGTGIEGLREKANNYNHVIKKRYSFNLYVVTLYSRVGSQIEPVMKTILWESGIRLVWSRMKSYLEQRRGVLREQYFEVDGRKWQSVRFGALAKFNMVMILLCCLCFFTEIMLNRICVSMYQKSCEVKNIDVIDTENREIKPLEL